MTDDRTTVRYILTFHKEDDPQINQKK